MLTVDAKTGQVEALEIIYLLGSKVGNSDTNCTFKGTESSLLDRLGKCSEGVLFSMVRGQLFCQPSQILSSGPEIRGRDRMGRTMV